MTDNLMEAVFIALEEYSGKDVLVFHTRSGLHMTTIGFFTWDNYTHCETTLVSLREDGWEKKDIKDLRNQAVRILIKEDSCGKFTAEPL
jgi:hypothetical protein